MVLPCLLGVHQGLDFAAFGQHFAGSGLVGLIDRDASGAGDSGIDQEEFVTFDGHIGAAQMSVPHAQALSLGTR